MELISARQAAGLLAGAGLSRNQSRRLLATGIAGSPLRTPSATLYDASRVRALLDWPAVDCFSLPDRSIGPSWRCEARTPRPADAAAGSS